MLAAEETELLLKNGIKDIPLVIGGTVEFLFSANSNFSLFSVFFSPRALIAGSSINNLFSPAF